jgi:aspartate aminotransferase-like enzyme
LRWERWWRPSSPGLRSSRDAVDRAVEDGVPERLTGETPDATMRHMTAATQAPVAERPGIAAPSGSAREPVRFFLPGPTWVRRDILEAMARPMTAHRSPEFKALYATVSENLKKLFRTERDVYTATGSSTLVMESAVISSSRDRVLNLTAGAFSERWHMICRSLARTADRVYVPWGKAIDPDLVREALRRAPYEAVTVVHNETSTGVLQPLQEIVEVVREESDAVVLVDAVSSLGGAPVEPEAWDLDLVLAGSQKALSLPPGLAFFTLSERLETQAYETPPRGWYTDVLHYRDDHRRQGGPITTPAIPVFYAAERQLPRVVAEGLEARWERHRRMAARTAEWAESRGVPFASEAGVRSPTVSCLRPPEGVGARELVTALADKGFTIGSGYGIWRDSTFRIGHMGEVHEDDLERLLEVLDETVEELRAAPRTSS